jgi:Domain of unknown function (DUF1707)/2TM domain
MCGSRHHHRIHHRHDHTAPGRTSTVPADDLRASDAEREQVIGDLRAHAGEGRLTVDELDERIGRADGARTRRELAALTADLPPRSRARTSAQAARGAREGFGEHLRAYLMVMALLVAIWALTGAGYFWPVWPALGWGIGLMSHAGAMRGPRTRRAT